MYSSDDEILDSPTTDLELLVRKDLLPVWVKVFCWLFGLLGFAVIVAYLGALFISVNVDLSVYGLVTNRPLSLIGLLIGAILLIKLAVAMGLLSGKTWAVDLAIIDAIFGIVICTLMTLKPIFNTNLEVINITFRLELLLLIPYLLVMRKIRNDWTIRTA